MTDIVSASDGDTIALPGAHLLMKVTATDTNGRYTLLESRNDPGWESELNRHPHDSKTFYVLEGAYEFYLEGRWGRAYPGDTLLIRAGRVHGFRAGPDGGHALVIYPGRAANWFTPAAQHQRRQPLDDINPLHDVESLGPLPHQRSDTPYDG
jgi:quercetin dioxygenase-like cupin family protein